MGKSKTTNSVSCVRTSVSRRNFVKSAGALGAASLWMPGWLLREAEAQSATFDFYIGPDGSDSNPGTESQPWALSALNTKRATYAGKRVGLLDGTYDMVTILGQPVTAFDSNELAVAGGPSPSQPTIIQAVNRHRAIIDGNRPARTSYAEGGLIGPYYGQGNVTFDGLKIVRAFYRSTTAQSSPNFTVKNCWYYDQQFTSMQGVGGKNSAMLFNQNGANFLVSNCRFEIAGSPADSDRSNFIQTYGSLDPIVEYCTIIGNAAYPGGGRSGSGIHFKESGNRRCTARYNYIDLTASTAGNGILWHGNGSTDGYETAHNNILIVSNGQDVSPIRVESASNSWRVYNNNFIGSPGFLTAFGTAHLGNPVRVDFYNNIISRSAMGWRGDLHDFVPLGRIGTMDHNLYDSSPTLLVVIAGGPEYFGLPNWQATGKDPNSKEAADPLFVGTGVEAERYRLQAGSPAKTLGAGGAEIGAWAGATQVGCSFERAGPATAPLAPDVTVN